jgi:dihydrofolate synthase/folylpolyglutamate synthase
MAKDPATMDTLDRHRTSAALTYLESRVALGVKFGLATVRELLSALDHPESAYAVLLVAGTNGKGSVVAYLDALLRSAGLRVGRYTSPHLVRLNERFSVDGADISDDGLDGAIAEVRDTAQSLIQRGTIEHHPTFFEILTVAAFLHFRAQRVDAAAVEVGMGGRFDATNAAEPLVSGIVSIALDHERFLGDTLDRIAREKAGVLRAGRATVVGPLVSEARLALEDEGTRVGAHLVHAREGVALEATGDTVSVRTPRGEYRNLRPLLGAHQRENLVVALRMIEEASQAGLDVDPLHAARGVADTLWPGRLEWFHAEPPILLDGAHNPAAAEALADYLRGRGPFVLVLGIMRDKDIAGVTARLLPLARAAVFTRPHVARAADPAELLAASGSGSGLVRSVEEPHAALEVARRLALPGEAIVVAGSLYLVGEVREILLEEGPWRTH